MIYSTSVYDLDSVVSSARKTNRKKQNPFFTKQTNSPLTEIVVPLSAFSCPLFRRAPHFSKDIIFEKLRLAAPEAEADAFFVDPPGCFRFRVDVDDGALVVEKDDVPGIEEADWGLAPLAVGCPLRVVIPGPLSLSTSGEPLVVF
jgi:hypothetical protein